MNFYQYEDRLHCIDIAKGIGIFLVIAGHFSGYLFSAGSTPAYLVLKLINSFHMPLFFFISGIFWHPTVGIKVQFIKLIKKRIVPVISFGIIALPFWFIKGSSLSDIIRRCLSYMVGIPELNWITWFLVCLFTTELLLIFLTLVFNFTKKSRLIFYSIITFCLGIFFCQNIEMVSRITGIRFNFWFIHESFIALSFYLFGYYLQDTIKRTVRFPLLVFLLLISFTLLILTYNKNFSGSYDVVVMGSSIHGEPLLFCCTAITGIFTVILLSKMIPLTCKPILFIGKNSLFYMGLNGVSMFLFDPFIAKQISSIAQTKIVTYLLILLYTTVLFVIFTPIVIFLKKYLPEMFGYKNTYRSIVPRMASILEEKHIKYAFRFVTGR